MMNRHLAKIPLLAATLAAAVMFGLTMQALSAAQVVPEAAASSEKPAPTPAASALTLEQILKRDTAKAQASTSPASGDKGVLATLKAAVANAETSQSWNPALVMFLTVAILLFGTAVLGMMTYLVMKDKPAGLVLRLFTVPLVIVASVFLVVTGFSNEQITPVVGLLGTIVGYILGSHSTRGDNSTPAETGSGETEKK